MSLTPLIVSVCEHGAAKSILAAAYFNRLASEMGSELHAIAHGTHSDKELSPQTAQGLSADGLEPTEPTPQRLSESDVRSARQIVTFCELPAHYSHQANMDHWKDIPPVSENSQNARDAILYRIRQMLNVSGATFERKS